MEGDGLLVVKGASMSVKVWRGGGMYQFGMCMYFYCIARSYSK